VTVTTRAIMDGEKIAAVTELAPGIPASDLPMLELMFRGRHVELMAEMARGRRERNRERP